MAKKIQVPTAATIEAREDEHGYPRQDANGNAPKAETTTTAKSVTFVRDTSNPDRAGTFVCYRVGDGRRGLVYFPVTLFADGKAPENFRIDGLSLAAPKIPAAKLTPEERKAQADARKAELAKLSPADRAKLAAERATAAAKTAAERAAKLAAAKTAAERAAKLAADAAKFA